MSLDLDTPYPLTREQIASYRCNGFIKLKQVLSPETLALCGREITRLAVELNTQDEPLEERSSYDKAFLQVMKHVGADLRFALVADAQIASEAMRGKDSAGRWREPFDPLVPTSPLNNQGDYTEANAWQYTATPALHDPLGFRDLLGGKAALEAWLDRFFAIAVSKPDKHLGQEALIGQYAHGNEPSHHIAWLYAFTDAPYKGHALVRRIASDFYSDRPDGIIGNDDCGQMSAWLMFAMLGLYPAQPASGHDVAGVPLLKGATLSLRGGRVLQLRRGTRGGVRLDGCTLDGNAIPHAALTQGGMLTIAP
jgi:putative alpha-1,2-mannosidase